VRTDVQRIVLLHRFTSFAGAATFYSAPINVRAFAEAEITVYRSDGMGTITTYEIGVDQSPDLEYWYEDASEIAPAAGAEATAQKTFELEWIRLRIVLAGTDPAVTSWAVGNFVPRVVQPA
jgi:hypothetical protein